MGPGFIWCTTRMTIQHTSRMQIMKKHDVYEKQAPNA